MKNLWIVWSEDSSDSCETCGPSWDIGAIAYLDGEEIYRDPAAASCFGSFRNESHIFREILGALGYRLEEDWDEVDRD